MRITVNLSLFLHDHRSVAKIFINEKNLKCIRDVECRISQIFEIDNFYLKCENQYLPPSEDVHILNHDDIVWAIPMLENKPSDDVNLENLIDTAEVYPVKKKKKKTKKYEEMPINNEELSQKIKKRKCKFETIEESTHNVEEKCNKKKKLSHELKKNDHLSAFKDSDRDSLDSCKSDELNNESNYVHVKSLVESFENQKNDFKKRLEEYSHTDDKKRVNIIKTIIISNKKTTNSSAADISSVDNSDVSFIKNETSSNKKNQESNSVKNNEINDACVVIKNKLETIDSSCYANSDLETGQIKRKRKRVRKRKHVNKESESRDVKRNLIYDLIPRPLLTKSCTPIHVRFKDDQNILESTTIDTSKNCNDIQVSVVLDEELIDPIKKTVQNEELTEEFILKQPITQNIQPRQGDIIAFKILRISENYTPEISSIIVGKVCSYSFENNEVIFDIISGQEQCLQPQGKFSLDVEEDAEEQKMSNEYQCTWSSLLEPRLLFP